MILKALAFLLTLGILVVIHEYGHYRVARACGVKVLRFSVGFGRVLWRRQKSADSTEFVVCALPLGGYVRMLDEREAAVAPELLAQAFNRQSLWKRAAIVAAGPAANLLLAVVLFAGLNWAGVDEPQAVLSAPAPGSLAERAGFRSGDRVQALSTDGSEWTEVRSLVDFRWHLTQAALHQQPLQVQVSGRDGQGRRQLTVELDQLTPQDVDAALAKRIGLGAPFSPAVMGEVKAGGAAAAAGLRRGDVVLKVDGLPALDAASLRDRVRANGGREPQYWEVQRGNEVVLLGVQPKPHTEGNQTIGRIEAVLGEAPALVNVRYGLFEGLAQGAQRTWELSAMTVRMLGKMLIGEASLRNLSGPLTIADYAGQSAQQGPVVFIGFLALVSVSLGVLNLLPLPMLDGGHLIVYIVEGVLRRPLSDLWQARLQRGGVAVLLAMMSVALFNDVARLLGLH